MQRSLSVVVPVYKGAESLPELIQEAEETLNSTGLPWEVILVDDGSPDSTWTVIEALCQRHPSVRGIRLMRNFGQHNALLAGLRAARYEVIVTMDDDLQHPPREILKLLEALTPAVDVVYGVAEEEEHGPLRSLASRLVKLSLAVTLRTPSAQSVSAFRAFRASLRDAFALNDDPDLTLDVLLSWSTTLITAVRVQMAPRRYGTSNYTVRLLSRHALNMITGYSTLPLRFVTYMGLTLSAIGTAILTYVVVHYLLFGGRVPGFTFIAATVALFSGAQMLALGILGEYMGRLHFRSMHRPQYLIRQTDPAGLGIDVGTARTAGGGGEPGEPSGARERDGTPRR